MALADFFVEDADAAMAEELCEIQRRCYDDPFYHEDEAVFRNVLEDGMSFVARRSDGKLIGYALVRGLAAEDARSIPVLNKVYPRASATTNAFIYDVSVDPAWRGRGVATRMVQKVLRGRHGRSSNITLVAVKVTTAALIPSQI
jgi:ribosomal protein S18 acetylase RimI-like enzyme